MVSLMRKPKTARRRMSSSGRLIQTLQHGGTVKCVSFSSSFDHVISGGTGGLKVWNVGSGRVARTVGQEDVQTCAMSSDGELALTSEESEVRLWEDERFLWQMTTWLFIRAASCRNATNRNIEILDVLCRPNPTSRPSRELCLTGCDGACYCSMRSTYVSPVPVRSTFLTGSRDKDSE